MRSPLRNFGILTSSDSRPTLRFVTKIGERHNLEKVQRNETRARPPLQRPSTSFTSRASDRSRRAPCDSHPFHWCMWWLPSLFQLYHRSALFSPTAVKPEPIMCFLSRLGPPPDGVPTAGQRISHRSEGQAFVALKNSVVTIRRGRMEGVGGTQPQYVHACNERRKERKDVDIANYFRGGRDADVHDVTWVFRFYHW